MRNMPPKSKHPKPEWQECVRCSCVVSTKDLSKHTKECHNGTNKAHFEHGFIWNETLYGVVSPYSPSDGKEIMF